MPATAQFYHLVILNHTFPNEFYQLGKLALFPHLAKLFSKDATIHTVGAAIAVAPAYYYNKIINVITLLILYTLLVRLCLCLVVDFSPFLCYKLAKLPSSQLLIDVIAERSEIVLLVLRPGSPELSWLHLFMQLIVKVFYQT